MLTPGESFSKYIIHCGATYLDGSKIVTEGEPITMKTSRPPQLSADGFEVTVTVYFQVIFSQTQKKPIKVNIHLEENKKSVSNDLESGPIRVVSKPPQAVKQQQSARAPSPKKPKLIKEEDDSDHTSAAECGLAGSMSTLSAEIAEMKQMMSALLHAGAPSALAGAGDSRAPKRKFGEALGNEEIVDAFVEGGAERCREVLQQLKEANPAVFCGLLAVAADLQGEAHSQHEVLSEEMNVADYGSNFTLYGSLGGVQ